MFRASLVAAGATSLLIALPRPREVADPRPLIEFTAIDDDSAKDTPPSIEDCGYYLRIRGTAGRSGGTRPGVAIQLRGDSLLATIASYRVSEFDPRDWQMTRWTLRIGNLESETYRVRVVAGRLQATQNVRLTFGRKSCALS